jgi:hypothetical protein
VTVEGELHAFQSSTARDGPFVAVPAA